MLIKALTDMDLEEDTQILATLLRHISSCMSELTRKRRCDEARPGAARGTANDIIYGITMDALYYL